MNRKRALLIGIILVQIALILAWAMSESSADSSGPVPTSTYIQFPDPIPRYPAILYYPDDAHNADCWVTADGAAISCLRRPAVWPCDAQAQARP